MTKTTYMLFLMAALFPINLLAEEDYRLLHRSPQVEGGYPTVGLVPKNGRFTASFAIVTPTSSVTFLTEEFDFEGKKIGEWDHSHWNAGGGADVPNKNLTVLTEFVICADKIANCDLSKPEGYMFVSTSDVILYHSPKFARNYPDFTVDGKYMLGKFGWGYSKEDAGEYSPSTGTCLIEVDTGREIWCKEEVVREHDALLSEESSIIVGDKAIYNFFSGERLLTFPQFAGKGDKAFAPQRPGMAVIIRTMSPDGKYFVATEGKCDEDRVKRLSKENGCSLVFLTEMETYLAEWDKGAVKKKIMVFKDNFPTRNLKPFYFLPDGLLAFYTPYPPRIRLLNMKGETVSEINNDKASAISSGSIWRLQPYFDLDNKVVVWPSSEEYEWRVYDFSGKLIGELSWKDPQGRESQIRSFAMINGREFIFAVDITTKKNKNGGRLEYIAEVYRGKFEADNGK